MLELSPRGRNKTARGFSESVSRRELTGGHPRLWLVCVAVITVWVATAVRPSTNQNQVLGIESPKEFETTAKAMSRQIEAVRSDLPRWLSPERGKYQHFVPPPRVQLRRSNTNATAQVVITTQRSGSTYFMSMLRSIQRSGGPVRTAISEPVGQLFREQQLTFEQITAMQWPDFEQIIRTVFSKFRCELLVDGEESAGLPDVSCGMKIMYNQIPGSRNQPTELSRILIEWMVSNRVKIIHLIRRSHVRKVLSIFRLGQTGIAHTRSGGEQRVDYDPLDIEPHKVTKSVYDSLRVSVSHRIDLRRHAPGDFLHEVYYEDLLRDSERGSGSTLSDALGFISPALKDLRSWIDQASTDIIRNPFMPCSMLVTDWEILEPKIAAIAARKLHDDPEVETEMRAELDFALRDCNWTSYVEPSLSAALTLKPAFAPF